LASSLGKVDCGKLASSLLKSCAITNGREEFRDVRNSWQY